MTVASKTQEVTLYKDKLFPIIRVLKNQITQLTTNATISNLNKNINLIIF